MARRTRSSDAGFSFVEIVVGTAIVSVLTSLAVPVTAHAIDAGRARSAAGFVASRLRLARQHAIVKTTAVALVFDRSGSHWTFRVCLDGNGNGVRRAEITAGPDTCPEGPHDLAQLFPGVVVDIDPRLPGPDGTPGTTDPVRFGASDIASFSPEGTGTAGTLFLRSKQGTFYAVRVANVTGRTRTLRFNPDSRTWIAG